MSSTLPPESWDAIVLALPRASRPACLLVSRQVHSVTQRIIFQNLAIDLGVWEGLRPANLDMDDDDDLQAMRAKAERRTEELIERVTKDLLFAQLVRRLSILSYVQMDTLETKRASLINVVPYFVSNRLSTQIVLDRLVLLVRHLPHLRSFKWFGVFPNIPSSISSALQHCSGLETLRLPACVTAQSFPLLRILMIHSHDDANAHFNLHHLTSISSISVVRHLGIGRLNIWSSCDAY